MVIRSLSWGLIAILVASGPAFAQKKNPNGAAVLLLTGGQREHHGYRDQSLYLAGLLENSGRYRVTICEDAAILETPAMAKYAVLIVNADRRDPEFKFTESQQKALLNYVKEGHGYVSIHGADNAAPDWLPEWKEMLGGVFSHKGLPDAKTKKGQFHVKITDTSSPITKGVTDFDLKDELYYHLQMLPGVEPLATISYEGADWPVIWTREYGKGKVFHTVLGHRDFGPDKDDPLQNPNLAKLVLQGMDFLTK